MRIGPTNGFAPEGADDTTYEDLATAHVSVARILGLFRPYGGGSRSSCS